MGCGASSRRRPAGEVPAASAGAGGAAASTASPELPSLASHACGLLAGVGPEPAREVCGSLPEALAKLGLSSFGPRLASLGVATLADVTELLVTDLEEAGLTRVQSRQLQKAASAGTDEKTAVDSVPACLRGTGNFVALGPPHLEERSMRFGALTPATPERAPVHKTVAPAPMLPSAGIMPVAAWASDPALELAAYQELEFVRRGEVALNMGPETSSVGALGSQRPPLPPRSQFAVVKVAGQDRSLVVGAGNADEPDNGLSSPGSLDTKFVLEATLGSSPVFEDTVDARPLEPDGSAPRPDDISSNVTADDSLEATYLPGDLLSQARTAEPTASRRPECLPCQLESDPCVVSSGVPGYRVEGINRVLTEAVAGEDGPAVAQCLPEALRRRLDQRAGQQHHRQPQVEIAQSCQPSAEKRSSSAGSVSEGNCRSPSRGRLARAMSGRSASVCGGEREERSGRQMLDKNELRAAHRELFVASIDRYRREVLCLTGDPSEEVGPDLSVCTLRLSTQTVRVYVRKRPRSETEVQKGDYDVVSVPKGAPLTTQLVLHGCNFRADLKTPFLQHSRFEFDNVFGEAAQNHEVYRVAISDLVLGARDGSAGTVLMFGQTGSGKTHTMTAIEAQASADIFNIDPSNEGAAPEAPRVVVQFVELCGNHCFDLFAPAPQGGVHGGGSGRRPELRVREQADGTYMIEGAVTHVPKSADELCALLRQAHACRTTSATEANSTSSRSHAVCTLRLPQTGGELTLADCAGTERRKDSAHHSREHQQEGAEINASLFALKECIRHAAARKKVPPHAFRASSLTKLLAGALGRGGEAKLAVICTVAPGASDTEHTVATLRTGALLSGRSEIEETEVIALAARPAQDVLGNHPKQWSPERVREWLANLDGGRFKDALEALPSNFTGQMLVRVTEGRCLQLCGGCERRGRLLFTLLHEEMRAAESVRRQPR